MKKEWVEKKEKERQEKIKTLTKQIEDALLSMEGYTEEELQLFIERFHQELNLGSYSVRSLIPYIPNKFKNKELFNSTKKFLEKLPYEELVTTKMDSYNYYLDSDPKHFTGDIIITDPCYIAKDNDWPDFLDDVYNGENDIKNFIERDTIYGDWSCTTFDMITKKPIGKFCADAGMVGVFILSEVLEYNPLFNYHTERPWTTTLIKDFDGDIWFEVEEEYDEEYGYDYSVYVIGKGTNTKTGERIEFKTSQTGL